MGWSIPIAPVGYTPEIASDTTTRTVNSTSTYTQLSGSFSIPASDAEAGSVYKLTGWGTTSGNAGGSPNLATEIFNTQLTTVSPDIAQTSVVYDVVIETWIIVTAAGASGSVNGMIYCLGGGGTQTLFALAVIPPTAVNTTVASDFLIACAPSAAGITMNASVYERDGPGASSG